MAMDPDLKTRWLAALRGGEIEQYRGALRGPDGRMCCLGVLCHVDDPSGWQLDRVDRTLGGIPCIAYRDPDTEVCIKANPSGQMLKRLGITWKEVASLVDKNDGGVPFAAIADHIEREF